MKKIISTFILSIMICSLFVSAQAESTLTSVLDLDFSGFDPVTYTTSPYGVTEANGKSFSVFCDKTKTKNMTSTGYEGDFGSLLFNDGNNMGTNVYYLGEDAVNQEEMTVEMWAYITASNWNRLFSIRTTSTVNDISSDNGAVFELCANGTVRGGRNTGNTKYALDKQKVVTFSLNKWSHIVLTRKWNSTDSKWYIELYVNNTKIGTYSASGSYPTLETVDPEKYTYNGAGYQDKYKLEIGGAKSTDAFYGALSTFKVYKGIMSSTEVSANYNKDIFKYTLLADTLELASSSISEGNEISINKGEIALTFNNKLDETTVNNIYLKKADGTVVNGTAVNVSDYTNVTVTYPKLAGETDYSLVIPETVASVNGKVLDSEKVINFKTKKDYIFYEDFEKYDEGTALYTGKVTGISYMGDSSETSSIIIKEASDSLGENKDKYVALGVNTGKKNSYLRYYFEEAITSGAYAVEFKIKGDSASSNINRNVMTLYPTIEPLARIGSGGEITQQKGNLYSTTSAISGDANGFIHFKYIFEKNPGGGFDVKVYNMKTPASPVESYTLSREKIEAVEFTHIYPGTTDTSVLSATSDVSMIKIYEVTTPEIISKTYNEADKTVTVLFSEDMDKNSFTNVTVNNLAGDLLNSTSTYYEDVRTLKIVMSDSLQKNELYNINLGDAKSSLGIEAEDAEIYLDSSDIIQSELLSFKSGSNAVESVKDIKSVSAVTAFINSTNEDKNVIIFVALYDTESKKMKDCVMSSDTISANSEKTVVIPEITAEGEVFSETDEIKVFVWDEAMKPLLTGGDNSIDCL